MPENSFEISRIKLSLAVILIGSFMAPLLMHSSTLAIPAIAAELRLDAELLSWFTLLNVLGSALLVLPAGKFADIYGRRRVFCLGITIGAVACLLGGVAESAPLLLAGRFLQGVGGAFVFGSSVALVSSIPPPEKKAQVMGVYIAICYLGVVAGPLFGGVVIEHFHWRWVFFIPAAVLMVTAVAGFGFLHWERYGDREARVRLLDTGLYMMSLVMIAFAVFRTNELLGQGLLALGLVSFAGFCWFQSKRRDPLLQVNLFLKNSIYTTLGLTHFFSYCGILALPFMVTLYLQFIKDIDAQTAGVILISQALVTALAAPASGWLRMRFRVRTLLFTGTILIWIGMLLLVALDHLTPVYRVVIALSSIGLGVGITDTQLFSAAMASVEERMLGSASATINGLRTMGGFVGIGVASFLMGRTIGKQEIVPALYPELMVVLQQFFIIAAVLAMVALLTLGIGVWFRSRRPAT